MAIYSDTEQDANVLDYDKQERCRQILAQRETAKDKREAAAERRKEKAYIQKLLNESLQKPVKRMVISIEWKKSRMWGNCPSLEAAIEFADGTFTRTDKKYYASGCGYDKACAVIDELMNDYMKWRLHQINFGTDRLPVRRAHRILPGAFEDIKIPYGVSRSDQNTSQGLIKHFYFDAGGVESYRSIAEFLGGTWETTASGKMFDVYTFEMKE